MGILMGGVVRSSATHGALPFASVCVTQTFHCYGTDGNGIWNNLSDGGAYAYSGVSVTASAGGFYPKTINMNNVAYYPDLGINGLWEIIELDPQPAPPDCCFTGDTPVLMADGSTRPIATIAAGDEVIGRDGSVNRVIAIERPALGDRLLYALNDGTPFVTAEHPFLTETGWAAIDPAATAAESPGLAVAPLAPGSRLVRVARVRSAVPVARGSLLDRPALETETTTLRALTAVRDDPARPVYNLLLDGDHTYVAAGYLVHNKTSSH